MTGDSSGGGERVAGGVDPEHPERRVVDHLARERTHHLLGKKIVIVGLIWGQNCPLRPDFYPRLLSEGHEQACSMINAKKA